MLLIKLIFDKIAVLLSSGDTLLSDILCDECVRELRGHADTVYGNGKYCVLAGNVLTVIIVRESHFYRDVLPPAYAR